MKFIFVIGLFAIMVSSIYSLSRAESKEFLKCLACASDDQARWDYLLCSQKQPGKIIEFSVRCMKEVLPIAKSIADLWPRICSKSEIAGQIYDCVVKGQKKIELNKEEKIMMKDFLRCAYIVKKTYCFKEKPKVPAKTSNRGGFHRLV